MYWRLPATSSNPPRTKGNLGGRGAPVTLSCRTEPRIGFDGLELLGIGDQHNLVHYASEMTRSIQRVPIIQLRR